MADELTVDDLVAMPHLGLQLVAGAGGTGNPVLWTHVSELLDPGPWLEGGELLIVNGFGIPEDPEGQVAYVSRLAHHRLAGIAVSVRAPELAPELLAEADRLAFPVLRIPREVPFVELSHLVANASERSNRGRLARHLRIFEALRLRSGLEVRAAEVYAQLELASGYRLALVTPAGKPLLPDWPWLPEGLDAGLLVSASAGLGVVENGYMIPLFVDKRVTAYLIGIEDPELTPGGLAALQHVGTIAVLDAIDDQRRREAHHRQGSALLADALSGREDEAGLEPRFAAAGLPPRRGLRLLAIGRADDDESTEIEIRDWLADRGLPHLLRRHGSLFVAVDCEVAELRRLAEDLALRVGVSSRSSGLGELPRLRRQALWALNLAGEAPEGSVILAEEQSGLARWLTRDTDTLKNLADEALQPILQHDAEHGTELLRTLTVYFQSQGRIRQAAAKLFVHEHTLSYRIKRIEQLTGRDLKSYRDALELWLAVEAGSLIDEL